MKILTKSVLLLAALVFVVCGLYPLTLWAIGQAAFPFQANGSMIDGPDGKPVGSRLIAQPFTKDEYFWPRPSAASYDASASASSAYAASNYQLRDRVARALGPIVTYRQGEHARKPVAPDVEAWFQLDKFQGQPHLVAQWADAHNGLAQAWVKTDALHKSFVENWAKTHADAIAKFGAANPLPPKPAPEDLAVPFFESFSAEHPGMFPVVATHPGANGATESVIEPANSGADIQSDFFDMWRQDHADAELQNVPADLVTASASGLDPHITLANAEFQLDRVAGKWAADLKREPGAVRAEIEKLLHDNVSAPWYGLAGEKIVNVLEINLALRQRYGAPQ
jgi:K+-transporting ATPase ATPase C chain